MHAAQTNSHTRASKFRALLAFIGLVILASAALAMPGARAYAAQDAADAAADADVRYIAILGADTWTNSDGSPHSPASDLTAVARVDTNAGVVSILTIPRDLRYVNMEKLIPTAKTLKCDMVFRYTFQDAIDDDWGNYDEAIHTAAQASCTMLTDVTGIPIEDYAVVDLNTYQDIITKLGGVTVDVPVGILNYRLYSDGQYYSVNNGEVGVTTFDAWDAMIAARSRETYCLWLPGGVGIAGTGYTSTD